MPWAGIGIVFFVVEGVIGPQLQPRHGAEQRDAVDLAPGFGDMFLEPPAQAAKEIQLPFAGMVVIGRVWPAQRVVAGPVEKGLVQ